MWMLLIFYTVLIVSLTYILTKRYYHTPITLSPRPSPEVRYLPVDDDFDDDVCGETLGDMASIEDEW